MRKCKIIRQMLAGVIVGVLTVGSTVSLAATTSKTDEQKIRDAVRENTRQIQEISLGQELGQITEQWNEPKALPAVIGKKVDRIVTNSNAGMTTYSISTYVAKSSATVKTSKAFFKQLHDNLTARKTSFTITYQGKYTDIYKGNVESMFEKAWSQDDKSTSDDFDYLYPNINTYGFYVPAYNNKKSVFKFKITYRESAAQLKKVNSKVKSVLKSLKLTKLTNKEKVKKIHDYVVNLFTYDRTLTRFTAYAGLIDSQHTTVCQGYAVLMYKMLTDAGVPCRYVTGYAGTAHAWNIVKIGSKWYHLDATWDDPVSFTPQLSYDYFLIGSKEIAKDHTLDNKFKTASFKKKYPISSTNFVWKDSATKPKDEVDAVTAKKQEFNKMLVTVIDEEFGYNTAGEVQRKMYDVYKEIVGGVFTDMPNDTFLKMYDQKDPDGVMSFVLATAGDKISEKILNPAVEYLDSDEFKEAYVTAILKNYTEAQWNKLSDTQKEAVVEKYILAEFDKKLQKLSKANSEKIISETLTELKNR